MNVWRTKIESVKPDGLQVRANLLIGKRSNSARFTVQRPEMLDYAELGRLVAIRRSKPHNRLRRLRASTMWNSLPLLNAIAFFGLWTAGIAGAVAAVAGLAGGLAASRASELTSNVADKKIADANRRAAEANERAETARLQAVQLAEGFSWRILSAEQRNVLIAELSGSTFAVYTSFVGSDPEASAYREDLDEALRSAGLKTKFFKGWAQAAGISILGLETDEVRRLSSAFKKAGIVHEIKPPHGNFGVPCPCIVIGTKPERL